MVVIGKVALFELPYTVTVAGTVAAVLLLIKLTKIPPVGAFPLSVTVPDSFPPPVT